MSFAPRNFAMMPAGTESRGGSVLATMTSPGARQSPQTEAGTQVKGAIFQEPLDEVIFPGPETPHPADFDAVDDFAGTKLGGAIVVAQPAGNHCHSQASVAKREGEIRKQHTRWRSVRKEKAIDKKNARTPGTQ